MAAEFIDDTENGSGLYPTKIPGYEDAADIQAALRLYHYGSTTIPASSGEINAKSIAGHLKALQDGLDNSVVDQSLLAGVGIDWNTENEQFDIDSTVATKSHVANSTEIITKVADFTLGLSDASKTILSSTNSVMTMTVPSNASVPIPVGYQFHIIEIGTGRTNFSPASGVTINSKNGQLYIDTTYGKATLVKVATDSWIAYGDIYEGVALTTTTAAPTTTTSAPTTTTTAPATTTTSAPPPATTTTSAPPPATTTTVAPATTTTVAPTTTTAAPAPQFITLPYETNVLSTEYTINWEAANAGSWMVNSSLDGQLAAGNGNGGTFTRTGLQPSTTYTQSVRLYTGANQTGTYISDAITVSTNMDPTTSYWSTGCCSSTNSQVTGDSSVNATYAYNDMISRCVGGTVTNIQQGQNSSVPSIDCTPATTTTAAPTTTTAAPTTTTAAPSTFGFASTSSTSDSVTASWSGAPAFTAFYEYVVNGTTLTTGSTSATVSGLSPSTGYTFTVRAKNSSNQTLDTISTTITTSAAPATTTTAAPTTTTAAPTTTTAAPTTTTAAPVNFAFTGTSSTSSSVTASWGGEPDFTAWYEYVVNGSTLTTGSTSATVSGLSPSTAYSFVVRAKNSSNVTLATINTTITTQSAPATTTTSAPATTTTSAPATTTTSAPATTTTAAPATTTTSAPATTTTSAPATTTTAAPATTTTAAPTTTTAAPATTTTAAPAGGVTCTSFDVSTGCCASTGCSTACGSGAPCSNPPFNRCYQGGLGC